MSASTTEAILLIRERCAHCAATADALLRLIKAGKLSRVEILNLDQHPQHALARQARSVPWLRLGPFELIGAHSFEELAGWAEHAAAGTGQTDYLLALLAQQQLPRVVNLVEAAPDSLMELLQALADPELDMGHRIGISAVVEALAGTPALLACVPELCELTLSAQPQTRADACHFLGLAGDPAAAPAVRRLLQDEQEDVRDIALETLALIDQPNP